KAPRPPSSPTSASTCHARATRPAKTRPKKLGGGSCGEKCRPCSSTSPVSTSHRVYPEEGNYWCNRQGTMRFLKGTVALLVVAGVAFGGSIAGTTYVLDSREEAAHEAQQEAVLAQERSEIIAGLDDSVEAAENAPEVRDNIGTYTVRCQVHEDDEQGPLLGFVFGNHHES